MSYKLNEITERLVRIEEKLDLALSFAGLDSDLPGYAIAQVSRFSDEFSASCEPVVSVSTIREKDSNK